MGNMCDSSCRCWILVSGVYPVAILSVVFCIICSLLMFVFHSSGLNLCDWSVCLCVCLGGPGFDSTPQSSINEVIFMLNELPIVFPICQHLINIPRIKYIAL